MSRRQLIRAINARLGKRKLIWLGTRGQDAQPLLELDRFTEVFSVAAPLGSLSIRTEHCLESMSNRRPNLDNYTLDNDKSPEAEELRRLLYCSLGEYSYLAAYRPHNLLSAICYPRSEFVSYLGLFSERHAPFEHKPWMETELRRAGIPVIAWRYYADNQISLLLEELEARGEMVLRASRTDGGFGLSRVKSKEDVRAKLPHHQDGFFAAAPVMLPHVPLNVGACIFPGGRITIHAPSVQLIGLPACTTRAFGYCGNDFMAFSQQLNIPQQQELERIVLDTGHWLAGQGYLGAFGIDAMLYQGRIVLVEVNPRFQGSSYQSAIIDKQLDRPDIYLCHIAAFLGLPHPGYMPMTDYSLTPIKRSHIIIHNRKNERVRANLNQLSPEEKEQIELISADKVEIDPEAIVCRLVMKGNSTNDGWSLLSEAASIVEHINATIGENISKSVN